MIQVFLGSMNRGNKLYSISASAGSGKTYRLTQEYLSLALRYGKDYFSHILAVTFTRKATKEMKERIVEELYRLSTDTSDENMVAQLSLLTGLSREKIKDRSNEVLSDLLTDYSHFRIKTIDSFFEEIVRSFAWEIGYGSSYRIDLDQAQRLHRATLLLLNNLDDPSHKESRNRIKSIVAESIANAQNYSVLTKLEQIGKELFSYFPLQQLRESQMPSTELIKKTRKALYPNVQKKTEEDANGKNHLLTIEEFISNSSELILQHLSLLAMLQDLNASIQKIGLSSNSMLLHSTQSFLNRIIAECDTPFIYERMGTLINHYMIDEFQDTNRMQYDNFKPLLQNTLSQGYDSLLVGDVKQSIYKFRNCDRTIFDKTIPEDFKNSIHNDTLVYNYRSAKEIVDFNNALFAILPGIIANTFRQLIQKDLDSLPAQAIDLMEANAVSSLYKHPENISENFKDCFQKIANEKVYHGSIAIVSDENLFTSKKGETVKKEEKIIADVIQKILVLCKEKDYSPGDIAILCYRNKQVAKIAETFLTYVEKHPHDASYLTFTGSETLRIINCKLVLLLIDIVRSLVFPDNKGYYEMAKYRFEQLEKEVLANEQSIDETPSMFDVVYQKARTIFFQNNLYDLFEQILHLTQFLRTKNDTAYVMDLLDMVYQFTHDQVGDAYSFLYWWDTKGKEHTLPQQSNIEAINILTIHKAKGLEFPVVLIPFPDWDLGYHLGMEASRNTLIWSKVPPLFNQRTGSSIEFAPIKLSTLMPRSVFICDFYQELTRELIDRLNLFYVATTRAKDALILWVPCKKKKIPESYTLNLSAFLVTALDSIPGCYTFTDILYKRKKTSVDKIQNIEFPYTDALFKGGKANLVFKHTAIKNLMYDEQIKYGSTMHDILSNINTIEDIHSAIQHAIEKGKVSIEHAKKQEEYITSLLSQDEISPFFSPKVQILKEQTMILPEQKNFLRPDRIVITENGDIAIIDYKFGKPREEHKLQINSYCLAIEKMDIAPVHGYLLYIKEDNFSLEHIFPKHKTANYL